MTGKQRQAHPVLGRCQRFVSAGLCVILASLLPGLFPSVFLSFYLVFCLTWVSARAQATAARIERNRIASIDMSRDEDEPSSPIASPARDRDGASTSFQRPRDAREPREEKGAAARVAGVILRAPLCHALNFRSECRAVCAPHAHWHLIGACYSLSPLTLPSLLGAFHSVCVCAIASMCPRH